MLSYQAGKDWVLESVSPLPVETRVLNESFGYALAEAVKTPHPMPLFDNSAVDGYAVRAEDLQSCSSETPVHLQNLGYLYAGNPESFQLEHGQCVQIATGAPVPASADSVVMKEDVRVNATEIHFQVPIQAGENVRYRGEDLAEGLTSLPSGIVIGSAQLAFLATFGFAEVKVHRKPRVSIISTGNELVDVDETPRAGQIRESNRFMLEGLVREAGCDIAQVSMVPDDPEQLTAVFKKALEADVLLVSGGMSVGEHDFAKPLLKELGVKEIFWKVSVKPGKPLFFGKHDETVVFGLPGNPASSYVIFMEFAHPALRKLRGCRILESPFVEAELTEPLPRGISRLHLMRGQLSASGKQYQVRPLPFQGSHSIGSLVDANALIWIEAHAPELPTGERVKVRPLINEIP